MAYGKIIYPSGDPAAVTYNFPKNFDYGNTVGYLESDDQKRSHDGTLNSYTGPRKKTFELTFSYATKTQFDYFLALWVNQYLIDLYLDGSTLDATVKIMTPPNGESQATVPDPTWTFTINFEEV
jgi:hypothetical protein